MSATLGKDYNCAAVVTFYYVISIFYKYQNVQLLKL